MLKFKRLADLNKRLVGTILIAGFVGFLVAFSWHKWVAMLLVLAVALLAVVGVWEYIQLTVEKNLKPASRLMMGVAFAEVLTFYSAQQFSSSYLLPLAILIMGVVGFFIFHFKYSQNALFHIAVEFFGVCYVTLPLCFMLGILFPITSHLIAQDGRWWLGYLIVVTKITDVGAYFVGRLWGNHKLAPFLSPKKTVEGAVAGFFSAVGASILIYLLGKHYSNGMFDLHFADSIWLGMLIGIMGQVGDLAESLLKRDAVVKDSNRLPGIGGVLDLLDSLLFTAPIVYLFLKMQ
jgi:phosphatidate cytidylyltransferase